MPITVSAIKGRVASVTVPLGEGGSIVFDYYPAKVSMIDQRDLDRMTQEAAGKGRAEQRRMLAAFLCDLVAAWDVLRDDETTPFPLDVDEIAAYFDDAFLVSVILALISTVNAGKVPGELSSALGSVTSSRTDAAESSPETKKAPMPSRVKSPLSKSPSRRVRRHGS